MQNSERDITEEPFFGFDPDQNTLYIAVIPRSISRYDLVTFLEKLPGYRSITMSDPVKKMNLTRFCWIEFDSKENSEQAELMMSGLMIKECALQVTKAVNRHRRFRIFKDYPVDRFEKDLNTIKRVVTAIDA